MGRPEEAAGIRKERNVKKLISTLVFAFLCTASAASLAEIKTVTLSVSGMT